MTNLKIYIISPFQDGFDDQEDTHLEDKFVKELENEYGANFKRVNIGPSIDVISFMTSIPYEDIASILIAGKDYAETIGFYLLGYSKIKTYLSKKIHKIATNHHAAMAIAVAKINSEFKNINNLILIGYDAAIFPNPGEEIKIPINISDAPDENFLAFATHRFGFKIGDTPIVVYVDGGEATIIRVQESKYH